MRRRDFITLLVGRGDDDRESSRLPSWVSGRATRSELRQLKTTTGQHMSNQFNGGHITRLEVRASGAVETIRQARRQGGPLPFREVAGPQLQL